MSIEAVNLMILDLYRASRSINKHAHAETRPSYGELCDWHSAVERALDKIERRSN
jgi:hypothetical protein